MIALAAIVVRRVDPARRESAFEARDRLWRSVEKHAHAGHRRGVLVVCIHCDAILMGATR